MRISYEVFVRAAAVLGVALEGGCHEAEDSAAVPRAIESLPGEPGEPTRGPCGARLACGAACVWRDVSIIRSKWRGRRAASRMDGTLTTHRRRR